MENISDKKYESEKKVKKLFKNRDKKEAKKLFNKDNQGFETKDTLEELYEESNPQKKYISYDKDKSKKIKSKKSKYKKCDYSLSDRNIENLERDEKEAKKLFNKDNQAFETKNTLEELYQKSKQKKKYISCDKDKSKKYKEKNLNIRKVISHLLIAI